MGAQDARPEDRARAGVRITAFGRGSPPAAEGRRAAPAPPKAAAVEATVARASEAGGHLVS